MKDAVKGKQGFASMPTERAKAIASLGGKAAHRLGKAHEWTPETARAAGLKGVAARARKNAPEAS